MTVRVAKLTDAQAIADLWNEAVDGGYFAFWETATSQVIGRWTLKQAEGQIDSPQFVYVDVVRGEILGFFLGYQAVMPPATGIRSNAERLVLWLVKVGVSSTIFEASLRRLFNYWFEAAEKRGYKYIWGTIPPNSPPGGLAFADNAKTGTDKVFSKRINPENGWPVYYARMPMVVQTAVTP